MVVLMTGPRPVGNPRESRARRLASQQMLCGEPLSRSFRRCRWTSRDGRAAQVEIENAGNSDDQLRAVAVLEQRELERLGAADEEAAAQAVLALHDPAPAPILADEEER